MLNEGWFAESAHSSAAALQSPSEVSCRTAQKQGQEASKVFSIKVEISEQPLPPLYQHTKSVILLYLNLINWGRWGLRKGPLSPVKVTERKVLSINLLGF